MQVSLPIFGCHSGLKTQIFGIVQCPAEIIIFYGIVRVYVLTLRRHLVQLLCVDYLFQF